MFKNKKPADTLAQLILNIFINIPLAIIFIFVLGIILIAFGNIILVIIGFMVLFFAIFVLCAFMYAYLTEKKNRKDPKYMERLQEIDSIKKEYILPTEKIELNKSYNFLYKDASNTPIIMVKNKKLYFKNTDKVICSLKLLEKGEDYYLNFDNIVFFKFQEIKGVLKNTTQLFCKFKINDKEMSLIIKVISNDYNWFHNLECFINTSINADVF